MTEVFKVPSPPTLARFAHGSSWKASRWGVLSSSGASPPFGRGLVRKVTQVTLKGILLVVWCGPSLRQKARTKSFSGDDVGESLVLSGAGPPLPSGPTSVDASWRRWGPHKKVILVTLRGIPRVVWCGSAPAFWLRECGCQSVARGLARKVTPAMLKGIPPVVWCRPLLRFWPTSVDASGRRAKSLHEFNTRIRVTRSAEWPRVPTLGGKLRWPVKF